MLAKHFKQHKMSSKDAFIKKIMDAQVILLNKHKLPSLFTYNSMMIGRRHLTMILMS